MNNKKHIVNLEYFRAMLQICPKLPNQQFEELPFEEAILTFLRDLGHSREIKVITDVNVNKLHQPWRSFAAVINKCLSGKSTGYDSLCLPSVGRFHLSSREQECQEEDDHMFTTIKVVSRHEDTQLYGAILPDDLTNEAIKDSESYKEYYPIASGAEPPKTKASVKKKQVESDKAKNPPATKGKRLKITAKVTKPSMKKQPTQGLETLSEVALTEEEQMRIVTKRSLTEYHSSHASGSGADEGTGKSSSDEDDDAKSENDNDDADNQDDDGQEYDEYDDEEQDSDKEIQDANVEGDKMNEEDKNEEVEVDALYRDVNINLEGRDTEMTDAPRIIIQTTQVIEDTLVIITLVNPEGQQQIDVPVTTFAEPPQISATTHPQNHPTSFITHLQQTPVPTPPTFQAPHYKIFPILALYSAVSSIPGIVDAYLANKMHEAVKTAVHLQSERLRDEAQAESADLLNKLADNIKKIIKDQVKEIVKLHPKILTKLRILSINNSNFSEVEKVKNWRRKRSDEQKNLYKALVDAYKSDKLVLDTYGETVSLKRRQDEEDKDEEPSAGSNWGSKRIRTGKEPESTSAPKEKTSKTIGKSTEGSKSHQKSADESAQAE
ncbi:hypothetical protein Tco_1317852 [Tanacetum coccineum]